MNKNAPDARLRLAAGFVRQGAVFADIGTDHAYLPLFLLESGKIRRAVCADIAEGPLANARAHAADSPRLPDMAFVRTDGLHGLESYGLTDIAICGMGGELIASVLAAAPFTRDPALRLILGPMSKQEFLRAWLYENGYAVTAEDYAADGGKYYLTLCATYTGGCRRLTAAEALLGVGELPDTAACRGYYAAKRRALCRAAVGKAKGGTPGDEAVLLAALDERFPDLNENSHT